MYLTIKNSINLKYCLILFSIFFIVFSFTSDGHRYTFDEDLAAQQSKRIATQTPDPRYVEGETRAFFEYPWLFPPDFNERVICQNAILCSQANVIHSMTQVPLILLNHNLNIITTSEVWTVSDFGDFHYVAWRNSIDPDFTFMELFYGPIFTALSTSVLFLIFRSYGISLKNSILVLFIYGFCTIAWAYSQTSLNTPAMVFFALLGYYFFRKWKISNYPRHLIFSGVAFGLAFLTRQDTLFIIIPVFFLILYVIKARKEKIRSFLGFTIPLFVAYCCNSVVIEYIRHGYTTFGGTVAHLVTYSSEPVDVFTRSFGMLFSPGAGLFIFSPVLVSIFVGFFDFYKKNKSECIVLLAIIVLFTVTFSRGEYWHGFNGWSVRYLVPTIPFLMIPIAFSLEKRGIFFKLTLLILGGLGFFINLVYLLQDTHWFVWGFMGDDSRGLYSLARKDDGGVFPIWISPLVVWSLEYSQLTQSVMWMISKLQPDLLLLKLLGIQTYIIAFLSLLAIPVYLLLRNIYPKTKLRKVS